MKRSMMLRMFGQMMMKVWECDGGYARGQEGYDDEGVKRLLMTGRRMIMRVWRV